MYCLKCKSKTESKDIVIEGKYEKSSCMVCDGKKCRIRSIKGTGMKQYARYAKDAYESVGNRFTNQDRKISTAETAVYLEGDDVIIAFRGTTPSSKDLLSDARILVGTLHSGRRFKSSLKKVDEVMKKYPNKNVILVGHSLGGRIATDIGIMKGLKVFSYNVGSSPVDVKENILQTLRCKFSSDEEHIRACDHAEKNIKAYHTFGDPLSLSSLTGIHNTEIVKPKHTNIHGIENFV